MNINGGPRASASAASLQELVATIAASDAMRSALSEQISRLPQWAVPELSAAHSITMPAAEGQRHEMEWLTLALGADAHARVAFEAILTPNELERLAAQRGAMTAGQLEWLEKRADLGSVHTAGAIRERLGKLFDASASRRAPLSAPEGADAASLQKYLAQPGRSTAAIKKYEPDTVRTFKTALFKAGHYDASFDGALRDIGYHGVAIQTPGAADLERFGEEQGFFLASQRLLWVARAASVEEYVKALPNSDYRNRFRSKLKRSNELPADVAPLSQETYAPWREVFLREVAGKPGGVEVYGADFVEKEAAEGALDEWQTALFRDPQSGRVVGGALLWKNMWYGGAMTVAGAAYDSAFTKYELSIKTMATALELASKMGLPLVSYGADRNLYGFKFATGLMSYKASLAMAPYPHGQFELVKVIDATSVAEDHGEIMFFSVKRGSQLERRYIESVENGAVPIGRRLLGARFTEPQALKPEENLEGQYFHFPGAATDLKKPHGIPLVKRTIVDVGTGASTRD